jgi:methionyl-tRNA synthetase
MTDRLYLTTTIPYVNAAPHIGFALELVQADCIARYHRQRGRTVRFQTGTDENAFKNVLSARALGVPVEQLVDENAGRFRAVAQALDVSHDAFVRTTEPAHANAVHAFLSRLREDDLYRAEYQGLYCSGCEDFYLERDLEAGLCPEHRIPVTALQERNYFFRLSAYTETIAELIASRRLRVVPEARESEVLRFVERGLADISISRDAARSGGWGIPFPGDSTQVVYVWIDALVNYLTGLGFPEGSDVGRFWSDESSRVHVVGKNVWKFHAIYWPALLISAGLPVPDTIVVHGFLTTEGEKISKSRGNATDPVRYVERFGADALRYFLLRHVRPFDDTDFSVERVESAYRADLANALGNLCSRLTTLCEAAEIAGVGSDAAPPAPGGFHEALDEFRLDVALESLWREIARINREVSDARPWVEVRAGNLPGVRGPLTEWARALHAIGYWLAPFLPSSSAAIRGALNVALIRKVPPLFPRLEEVSAAA